MLRQSVNSAVTRNISAGVQAQASRAKSVSQMTQPRMRRDIGCAGTAVAARSGRAAGASYWVAMSAMWGICAMREAPGADPALLARNDRQCVLAVPAANSAI